MTYLQQTIEEILGALSELHADWIDDEAAAAIAMIRGIPEKPSYSQADIQTLFDQNFKTAELVARSFLGLSKDSFNARLKDQLGGQGAGKTAYKKSPQVFIDALTDLGLLEAMQREVNRTLHWSDTLLERLRSGRGSAIAGQRRGRDLEDQVEGIVKQVVGAHFQSRCNFVGQRGLQAKCDIAIPNRDQPRIIIEAKGYNATGSKMTDVIGDIQKIIQARRADMHFLFVTDGLSWKQRTSDLQKIVEYQNHGDIHRIYTTNDFPKLLQDLQELAFFHKII